MKKERPKWPLQRLKGMYFAMHCWKCKKFELPMEEYKIRCENNIQKIIDDLNVKKMKFNSLREYSFRNKKQSYPHKHYGKMKQACIEKPNRHKAHKESILINLCKKYLL